MSKKENKFQQDLVDELERLFPDAIIMKNDPDYIQGIPDLTILHGSKWATLECKRSEKDSHQPNQDYYVEKMNGMSYSAFIYPENKEVILNEVQRALRA